MTRIIPSSALLFVLSLPALASCSDDSGPGGGEGTLSTDSGTSGDESDTTGEPVPDTLAHDIDIASVEINQGVAVPIAVGGEWVGGGDRNAPIIAQRKTLLRVYWQRNEAFVPREIEARLTISRPELEDEIRTQILPVTEESFPGGLDRSFLFDFVEEDIVPGMSFSVSLWEVDPAFAVLEPPAVEPITPRDGPALIGVQAEPTEMKIVIVPVHVDWPGCSKVPPTEELLQIFEDMMFMKNPTQAVTLEVRETPIVLTTALSDLWEMMEPLQAARDADQAAANEYYYGLMDACGTGSIGGAGGMAFSITPPGKDVYWQRVATGLSFGDNQWAADTFVHEIGHLQGLAHVACPGEEAAEPDPDFPYDDGVIGIWGFGLRDFQLYSPTASHDFMSYCYSGNWSSDWTWTKTFERIRNLTSWDYEGAPADPAVKGELLIGIIPDDGREPLWWTTPGSLPTTGLAASRALATTARGQVRELPVLQQRVGEGGATVISIQLPPVALRSLEFAALGVHVPPARLAERN